MKRFVEILSLAALYLYVSEVSEYKNVHATSGPVLEIEEEDPEAAAAEKEKEKAELYPFTPAEIDEEESISLLFSGASERFDKETIVGIKLKKNKIIYFTNDITYYTEKVSEGENFSKLDSFSQYPNLLSVEFCDCKISRKELENIRDFLTSSEVKVLSFDSCVIAEEDAPMIGEIISKQNALMALTVKFIRKEQKRKGRKEIDIVSVSPAAWESITKAISEKQNLIQLNLACGDITADSCDHIATAMNNSKKLTSLLLCWNNVSGEKADEANTNLTNALSQLTGLTKLCISILDIPANHIESMFKSMEPLKELTELTLFIGNMRDCRNIYDLSAALGQTLLGLTKLTSLQIQNMELSSNAMQAIAENMVKMTNLSYLDISNNEVGKEAAELLHTALQNAENFKVLIARNCHMESLESLQKTISEGNLEIVCLGGNRLGKGIEEIKLPESAIYIDLTGNDAAPESIITFLKNALVLKGLKAADLRNNSNLTEEQRDEIERLQADQGSTAAVLLFNPKSAKKDSKKKKSGNGESDSKTRISSSTQLIKNSGMDYREMTEPVTKYTGGNSGEGAIVHPAQNR